MKQPATSIIRLVCLFIVLLPLVPVRGQLLKHKSATVSNVRVEGDSERVKIQYDATGLSSSDSVYIRVESQSRGLLNAMTVTGDVGKAVLPGKNKTIYWDYRLDGLTIDNAIRVVVRVKPAAPSRPQGRVGGGAANALLSVLAPGVGSIFVQPSRKVGWRPLITGAYAGLLVYGLVQKSRSNQAYDQYTSLLNDGDYAEANRANHHYLVATWTALAVLLTDVSYTLLKGMKNDRQRKIAQTSLALTYAGAIPSAGVRLRF